MIKWVQNGRPDPAHATVFKQTLEIIWDRLESLNFPLHLHLHGVAHSVAASALLVHAASEGFGGLFHDCNLKSVVE